MKSYVWLSFAFMGWAYYEMSGGADFVPEQSAPQLLAEAEADLEKTVAVTRADTTTLLSVSSSNVEPAPLVEEVIVELAVSEPESMAVVDLAVSEPENSEQMAEPALDLREVAGSRVNMRMGPSTSFDVITTLTGGTEIEVIEVNAEGWANIRTVDRGIEGWMAERLLTDPQT